MGIKPLKIMKMENINIKWILLCFISISLISCSQDKDEMDTPVTTEDVSAYINVDMRALPAGTSCDMYIFWKQTGSADDYTFKEKKLITESPTTIHFKNADLVNKSYRFLFMTFDGSSSEMSVIDKTTGALNDAAEWNDVVIRAQKKDLSGSNFYGIVDKTGTQIMDEGTIEATLTRMVGQIVVDLFKINGTIDNPVDIIGDGSVASVIDRVYKIDIKYEGLTQDVSFDASNNIQEDSGWGETYTQTITTNINESNYQVPVNGAVKQLEKVATNPSGSVRIKGLYLFPSDKKIKCQLTFYYYDTTPKCGVPAHAHTQSCYDQRTLTLYLPQESSADGLTSIADYYTLSKGGIRYNRIIDLDQPASFGFDTTWENER